MIIHLVRHGQPLVGNDGLYLPNAGLTELGRLQATQVAKHVVSLNPEAAFTSNVPRAIETASHFSAYTNQPASQIPDLGELETGNIWDAPDPIKRRISSGDYHVDFKALGGETLGEFNDRVKRGFAELLAASSSRRLTQIVAFLHEGVIGTIIDHMEGRHSFDSKRRESMPYGSLITINTDSSAPHFPGQWDTDHLE
jgi:broad specificity phosphatase PhoE